MASAFHNEQRPLKRRKTYQNNLEAVSDGVENFSNYLFKIIANKETGNLITSPLAANIVLAMISYGARDNTKIEMQEALRMPNENFAIPGYQELIDNMNKVIKVDFKLANKIFLKKDLPVKAQFKVLTKQYFRSEHQLVDFSNSAQSAKIINTWCEEETNNTIKNVIDPNTLNQLTDMILVTAVYFKGEFSDEYKFNAKFTKDENFHVDHNNVKRVKTMCQIRGFLYGKLPKLNSTYLEIPYKGDEMSMIIILPNKPNGLQAIQSKMEDLNLKVLRQRAKFERVELRLPKFQIESSFDLNDSLPEMGMREMFVGFKANFLNIADKQISVSHVAQKAFIKVDENGSEATAATFALQVGGRPPTPKPKKFFVDRPSLFIIAHGNIPLFVGNLVNP